jgi:hypothetical protein
MFSNVDCDDELLNYGPSEENYAFGSDIKSDLDDDNIAVVANSSQIRFFIKGDHSESNTYLEYCLKHDLIPAEHADIWGLYQVYEVQKQGPFGFKRMYDGYPIVSKGVWEIAIKESGAADFVGGRHGDHVLDNVKLFADGVEIELLNESRFECKNLLFVQRATLYHDDSQTPMADHLIEYDISRNGIELTQELKFVESTHLSRGFMSMFPIRRRLNGETGVLITDSGKRDDVGSVEDISDPGFPVRYTHNTKTASIWGDESGIKAIVEIFESPGLPNANFHFSPKVTYNKLYYDISRNYLTDPGEEWMVKSRYKISTGN